MNMSTQSTDLDTQSPFKGGQVELLQKRLNGTPSPIGVIRELNKKASQLPLLLLESSEIQTRANLKSLLMLEAALRIECRGQQVVIKAMSNNGQNALMSLKEVFASALLTASDSHSLQLSYPRLDQNRDEMSRLRATNPIDALRRIQTHFANQVPSPFGIFLGGVFGFDLIASFEDLPDVETGTNQCPDFLFYLSESTLIIDHQNGRSELLSCVFAGGSADKVRHDLARTMGEMSAICENTTQYQDAPDTPKNFNTSAAVTTNLSDQAYAQAVNQLKNNIIEGDVFQVVPARQFRLPVSDTLLAYQTLKSANPSPYMFYLNDEKFCLFGASPESALKYTAKHNQVELYPIAGTRPRGVVNQSIDADLDSRIEAELKQDQKEIAEHMMLVDLARNDIARISEPGSVKIPRLIEVDRYSKVMHLVSKVTGTLKSDLDAFHAYQACMNMGTLTGAPKIKATELIRLTEKERRGSYGGAIGYINAQGDMDTCIVIRSAYCEKGQACIQAGAGIVFDSDPNAETAETRHKAQAVIDAILKANALSESGENPHQPLEMNNVE